MSCVVTIPYIMFMLVLQDIILCLCWCCKTLYYVYVGVRIDYVMFMLVLKVII